MTHGGAPRERATAWAEELGLPIMPFDAGMAQEAAGLPARHRRDGLSLGDAACLACATTLGRPVYTTGWAWSALGLRLEIRQLR
jgi:PIN domain nuclease of toxin-antitoxin system